MRRGFKAWCEKTAINYREALGLEATDRLDPQDLAQHLGVSVWQPEDIPDFDSRSLHQLTQADPDSWSAVTIGIAGSHLTIINSTHSKARQHSSICHELSHLILKHEPDRIDLSPDGHLLLSSYEGDKEEEANWLSSTLLVPRAGLQKKYRSTRNTRALARHFGVSVDMLNWRLRMTGVVVQTNRARAWARRQARS